ncbi:hypothetical protein SAMN05421770_103245 [Granulicella rosea]|uniref:Uncharacterized protein n=1 Tax=Granulicella rosea TaxID=474952 RepID=A0A239IRT2_9BACT|nr:hypothetical protein [Granulicella rosea]SNS96289.1 hypothetical protein SAMN05421770_103245 [Granulicella rosea]
MANRANPARVTMRLRILLAMLCLIAFATGPTTCLATMPHMPIAQAASVEADCSPCCSRQTPASVELGCCTAPQDLPPAHIAAAATIQPALIFASLEPLPMLRPASFVRATRIAATSPPPPRLVALRI